MISVNEQEEIRRAHLIEGDSLRKIEREKGYSRRTIRKALESGEGAGERRGGARESPVLGPYKAKIEALLEESRRMPRKQRYTGHQIYKQIEGLGYRGSESGVHVYVWHRRGEEQRPQIFLPLGFEPGQDGQVDFGEAQIELNGEREVAQFIDVRLNYSRKPFVRAYPNQKQECFFEGQVAAFNFFGGVPYRLTYDNLKAAVLRVLKGRARIEQRRFSAFRSHHLFESHFCTPGEGHEKGGVENGIGYAQRNLFVPLIQADSWDEVNAQLLARCQAEDTRTVRGQAQSIGAMFAQEQALLLPLPPHGFRCCATTEVALNGYGQVTYETNRYSVPVLQARKQLTLHAYPFRIEILDGACSIATHVRCYGREQEIFDPLHYLPLLEQRPGAFQYARPMRTMRQTWPAVYERALTICQQPDAGGIREMVSILRLLEQFPAAEVEAALAAALRYGRLSVDAVRLHLRQTQQPDLVTSPLNLSELTQAHRLRAVGQQPLQLTDYNRLLTQLPLDSLAATTPTTPIGGVHDFV
jgi:transposase